MKKLVVYFLLLLPSFIFFSLLWYSFVEGRLYYCSDPLPILGFIPPFVHGSNTLMDHWIAAKETVYATWLVFVTLIVIVPYLVTRRYSAKIKMRWFVLGSIAVTLLLFFLIPYVFLIVGSPYDKGKEPSITQEEAINYQRETP